MFMLEYDMYVFTKSNHAFSLWSCGRVEATFALIVLPSLATVMLDVCSRAGFCVNNFNSFFSLSMFINVS